MPSLLSQVNLLTVRDQASVQYKVPSQSSSLDDNSGHIEFLKNVFYQGLPVSTHPYYQDAIRRSAQIIYHEMKLRYLKAGLPKKCLLTAYKALLTLCLPPVDSYLLPLFEASPHRTLPLAILSCERCFCFAPDILFYDFP